MSVLIIGPDEQKQITAAVKRASENVVPWATSRHAALRSPTFEMKLKDRKPGVERPSSEHLVLGNVRVAYSHEEQPAGIFRHLSASVRRPGKLPHPVAIAMICEAFGFTKSMCEVLSSGGNSDVEVVGRVWLEEFDPGHHAVNVVERIAS